MAVSTESTTLQRAIVNWRDSYMGVARHQPAGNVQGSLQDLCIEARIPTFKLPSTLHDLYVEAGRRSQEGRSGTFDVVELIRTANEALGHL